MERITSRQNPLVQRIRKLAASPAFRRAEGLFLCDGEKLVREAAQWQGELEVLILAEGTALSLPARRVVELPADLLRSVAPTDSPQGVLALCRLEPRPLPERLEGRRYLVLEGVQDPGNVGTILRTADAFEADGLFLLPGCADPFGPKAVRATMGALFRRPVWQTELEPLLALLERSGVPLIGAALGPDTLDVRALPRPAAVAIGSEGRGLSPAALAACRGTVRIPMSPRCESLNAAAAAAVLLWELYRGEIPMK